MLILWVAWYVFTIVVGAYFGRKRTPELLFVLLWGMLKILAMTLREDIEQFTLLAQTSITVANALLIGLFVGSLYGWMRRPIGS